MLPPYSISKLLTISADIVVIIEITKGPHTVWRTSGDRIMEILSTCCRCHLEDTETTWLRDTAATVEAETQKERELLKDQGCTVKAPIFNDCHSVNLANQRPPTQPIRWLHNNSPSPDSYISSNKGLGKSLAVWCRAPPIRYSRYWKIGMIAVTALFLTQIVRRSGAANIAVVVPTHNAGDAAIQKLVAFPVLSLTWKNDFFA